MEPLILYFIKVNVALAVLYGFYKLSFSKDTFFGLRRLILILIYITSFAYPLLSIDGWIVSGETPAGQAMAVLYQMILPEVIVIPHPVAGSSFSWIGIGIGALYVLGVGLLLMRTLLELGKTYRFLNRCPKAVICQTEVCLLPEEQEPYSFLRWICLHPQKYTEREVEEILIHERVHVQEQHSADILLAQVVIILCWFNPFAWLIRNEIRINHEYLADKRVVASGCDKKTYQYHLIGLEHTSLAAANLYNNFSVLPLKKRIKMLNKKRTRNIMKSKYLMFIPVAALLIIFSNCSNTSKEDVTATEAATEAEAPVPEPVKEKLYEVVEVMPIFPGGNEALMKFLSNEIKYPDESVKKGDQGRVIVQFVVNKDGTIADLKVVKGVTPLLDAEALRVMGEMPKWTPGMEKGEPVRVKYTVPVMFRLQ